MKPKLEEIMPDKPKQLNTYTREQMLSMWPQAAGELQGFANHMRRGNAGLTAAQLEMAIQMSNEYLELIKKQCPSPPTS